MKYLDKEYYTTYCATGKREREVGDYYMYQIVTITKNNIGINR